MIENQAPVEPAPATPASGKKWVWWLVVAGGCVVLLCAAIVVGAAILFFVPVTTR